jgi:lactate dehydrogenase-like 2-hydroxyacid dehydrogenase
LKLDNVVLTPHVAYKTEEALNRRMEVTVKNISDFLQEKNDNRVD